MGNEKSLLGKVSFCKGPKLGDQKLKGDLGVIGNDTGKTDKDLKTDDQVSESGLYSMGIDDCFKIKTRSSIYQISLTARCRMDWMWLTSKVKKQIWSLMKCADERWWGWNQNWEECAC